jgi:hypothetical protein
VIGPATGGAARRAGVGLGLTALCAWLAAAPAVPVAMAAEAAPADHAAEAAPIAAEAAQKYGLAEAEIEDLRTQVAVFLDRGGDARAARDFAAAAAGAGCRAGCLPQAFAAVNRAVWLGHPPDQSRNLVVRALKDAARAGGPGTLAEGMQARMERFHRRSAGF